MNNTDEYSCLLVEKQLANLQHTTPDAIAYEHIVWRMPANQTLPSSDSSGATERVPLPTTTIKICVAKEDDRNRLLNFLRIYYYPEEPLTAGSEPKQQEAADEEFNMSNIKHGTCLMALRCNDKSTDSDNDNDHDHDNDKEQEEIFGALIAGPKDSHELEHLEEEAAAFGSKSKWGRILKILACIEREANVFERFGIERALHCHALGVHHAARGLALGSRLIQELMTLGRKRNFQLLTVDCSSLYSARLCERLGMECVNVKRFEDYRDEDGNQVFRPEAPHDEIKTFAIRL